MKTKMIVAAMAIVLLPLSGFAAEPIPSISCSDKTVTLEFDSSTLQPRTVAAQTAWGAASLAPLSKGNSPIVLKSSDTAGAENTFLGCKPFGVMINTIDGVGLFGVINIDPAQLKEKNTTVQIAKKQCPQVAHNWYISAVNQPDGVSSVQVAPPYACF